MVDVGEKAVTAREAVASGRIKLSPEALEAALARKLPKGDAITAAETAASASISTPVLVSART
jgi:cyclic pyranopterin phosphate synthase